MAYTVLSQRQTTVIDVSGNLTQVMEVTFQTTDGVVAHVDIPVSQYNVANVQAAIQAYEANITAVHQLGT